MNSVIDIRRSADRFHTEIDWLDSYHSFSFGPHRDPTNTGHGQLVVFNDDIVRAGAGFGTHPHQNMEIVTWVLSGQIEHRDSVGNHGLIYPGLAQRMSAGRGIRHSEHNPDPAVDAHFVQMWIVPDTAGIDPGYEQLDVSAALATGELVPVASGQGHPGAITIHQRDAVLWAARLATGARAEVPSAAHVHVFSAVGAFDLITAGNPVRLAAGDAARLVHPSDTHVVAGADGAEVLIWTTA